uniref:Kalata-B2 n=1 Tax=Oldenlandia affinis TaxID=60225 RepID=KAB2_OLDAF|nr:RecName: Full=Kalata-B2; Flags: Precursor [Oldenlandia affinis]AAL05480.1 kalata B2 precursor [Oldenlandia affinis]
MAKFTNCLVLSLLLAAFVGAFGAEFSEADKATLVNDIAENIQKEILGEVKTSETVLTMFLKEMQLKGLPVCGETCFGGTCNTPGCSCTWPICTRDSLPMRAGGKTSETTLHMFLKEMQLKGLPVCGETCFGGTCNTPGCSCTWPICTRDSLPMSAGGKTSETTLHMFLKEMQLKGLPVCGETCFGGTCNTPGCSCTWPICTRDSLPLVAA